MKAVKESIARGTSIEQAIKAALLSNGLNVQDFAAKYRLPYIATTTALKGRLAATPALVQALVEELGGKPKEWRELLWLAGKPEDVPAPKSVKAAAG